MNNESLYIIYGKVFDMQFEPKGEKTLVKFQSLTDECLSIIIKAKNECDNSGSITCQILNYQFRCLPD